MREAPYIRSIPRQLPWVLGLAVIMAVTGPFGSYGSTGLGVRLVYFVATAVVMWLLVLGFAVSIFVVRYTHGVLSGVMPHLRAEPLWIVLSGGVGGVVTGIGLGWFANLLLRAYRPVLAKG